MWWRGLLTLYLVWFTGYCRCMIDYFKGRGLLLLLYVVVTACSFNPCDSIFQYTKKDIYQALSQNKVHLDSVDDMYYVASGSNGSVYGITRSRVVKVTSGKLNSVVERNVGVLNRIAGIVKIENIIAYEGKKYVVMIKYDDMLSDMIRSGVYKNDMDSALRCFYKIICAVDNLHNAGFAHMDLKANNVMFDSNGNVVIIDLGSLVEGKVTCHEQIGAIRNYSYDVANGLIEKTGYDARKYDIWCLGLMLYHMIFGEQVGCCVKYGFDNIKNVISFGGKRGYIRNVRDSRSSFDVVKDTNVNKLMPDGVKDLLSSMLTRYDKDRISLKETKQKLDVLLRK